MTYDQDGVDKQLEFLLRMEASWKRFLGAHGIKYQAFTYEDLNKDLARRVVMIGRMLKEDVQVEMSVEDLSLKKQGTSRLLT